MRSNNNYVGWPSSQRDVDITTKVIACHLFIIMSFMVLFIHGVGLKPDVQKNSYSSINLKEKSMA